MRFVGCQNVFTVYGGVIAAAAGFIEIVAVLTAIEKKEIFVLIRKIGDFTNKFGVGLKRIGRNSPDHVVPNVFFQNGGEGRCNATHDQTIQIF